MSVIMHWRSKRFARSGVLVGAVAVAVVLSACGSSGGSGSGSGDSSKSTPFLIGAVQPLTGAFGPVGLDILHATEAEANILNAKGGIDGHKIKVISADDGSSVQRGISATQQMISQNKLNLFIPDAVNAQSQLPFAKDVLSFSNCSQAVCGDGSQYPLAFTTNPPASVQVPPLIAYAKKNGWTKVGVLAQDTSDGQFFASQVQKLASPPASSSSAPNTSTPPPPTSRPRSRSCGRTEPRRSSAGPSARPWASLPPACRTWAGRCRSSGLRPSSPHQSRRWFRPVSRSR